jgi:putative (di)nucleoside polyphosphate hydrolase
MSKKYRKGIGAMILNQDKKVFVAKRMDFSSGLQMPQGGIDDGETFEKTLYREMKEEIGTDALQIIRGLNYPLFYDFPKELAPKIHKGEYLGQEIYWFLVKFEGHDNDINLETEHKEFNNWQWSDHSDLVCNVVSFKKTMYQTVVDSFRAFF